MTYESPANLSVYSKRAEHIFNAMLNSLSSCGRYTAVDPKTLVTTNFSLYDCISTRDSNVGVVCKIIRATNNELQLAFKDIIGSKRPGAYYRIRNDRTPVASRNNNDVKKWLGWKMLQCCQLYLKNVYRYNVSSIHGHVDDDKYLKKYIKSNWSMKNTAEYAPFQAYEIADESADKHEAITIDELYVLSAYLLEKKLLIKRIKKNKKASKLLNDLVGEEFDPFMTAQEENRRNEVIRLTKESEDKIAALNKEKYIEIEKSENMIVEKYKKLVESERAELMLRIAELNKEMEELRAAVL